MRSQLHLGMALSILLLCWLGGCRENGLEQRKMQLERYLTIWNSGDIAQVEQVVHPEFVLRMTPRFAPEKGRDQFIASVNKWRTAYPDFHVEVKETVWGEDAVAVRWRITATHTGPGWMPPTGRRVDVPGMSILHFSEGKIKDEWIGGNNGYWLEQLGFKLMPPDSSSN